MKKLIAPVLAIMMLCFCLTSCGKSNFEIEQEAYNKIYEDIRHYIELDLTFSNISPADRQITMSMQMNLDTDTTVTPEKEGYEIYCYNITGRYESNAKSGTIEAKYIVATDGKNVEIQKISLEV